MEQWEDKHYAKDGIFYRNELANLKKIADLSKLTNERNAEITEQRKKDFLAKLTQEHEADKAMQQAAEAKH